MVEKKDIGKKRLGTTGLITTPMGLGLAALGRPGYINLGHARDLNKNYSVEAMEKHCHQMLDQAWALGIRYFDVARSYGRAEAFLGSWLKSRKIEPREVTVGSKWGYTYTANWGIEADVHEVKEHSVEVLLKQWQESQGHLAGWLKLYQIHSATLESGVLQNSSLLHELANIKSQNIAIGLSLSGTQQKETLEKALDVRIDKVRLFDVVQATWNLLETSAGPVLQKAHKAGMGVIIKEGVANGRLTDRNNEFSFSRKKESLSRIAAEHKCGIDSLALAYILKLSWVDIVLSGAATIEHLVSNVMALELKDLPEIDLAEEPRNYWDKRSELEWN